MTTIECVAASPRRLSAGLLALLAAVVPAFAESPTASTSSGSAAQAEAIMLSRLGIGTTKGKGDVVNHRDTGFKTNQELTTIRQSVTVITRDLTENVGATRTSDIPIRGVQTVGGNPTARG